MKAFAFPLEKVMSFRKRQWEAEAALLDALLANRHHLEAQRQHLIVALGKAREALVAGATLASERLAEFCLGLAGSREAILQLEKSLARLQTKIEGQQRAVLSARRNYELVAKLREKRYAEWQREADREQETTATESHLARLTQRRLAVSSRPLPKAADPQDAAWLPAASQPGAR
jgi:flagellar export protein FliJ